MPPRPIIETHAKQQKSIAVVEATRTTDHLKGKTLEAELIRQKLEEMKIICPQKKSMPRI